MKTDGMTGLAISLVVATIFLGAAIKDPWPMICATIVFLAIYLERALLDRQELERIMEAQKEQLHGLIATDRDLEDLKAQMNAIQLTLGMKQRGK